MPHSTHCRPTLLAAASLAALALGGCATLPATDAASATPMADAPARMIAPVLTGPDAVDPYSFARPAEARVHHVALDLALDFAAKVVRGTAILDIQARPGARELVLDTDGLEIGAITDGRGRPLPFTLAPPKDGMGSALTIGIGGDLGDARQVRITYASRPGAGALQWLAPEQTAGKRHPYLLSQGQPTLNRSWVPTQDSPGIRQTWDARIVAPEPITVVMSGDRLTPQGEPAGGGLRAFRFRMDKPVAPYLIAIAAGDIAFRPLGPRSGVWTEPAMLDAAAAELADTERMIDAAEALYGPYRWGRYDMVVLPPSFPYGGMENPTLTFLTPTFIAGDKSLNGLVAHELAHSWSGNLVTNATWADGWINEGFTSYFENRIMEALYGPARARQEEALSFAEVEGALAEHGAGAAITRLRLPAGEDVPDGGASGIIYDKGATFLRTLERTVGRQRFDAWLRRWFDAHAFQPATSAMLLADMEANLVAGDPALASRLLLRDWIYEPGLPANVARPDPAAFAAVDAVVRANAVPDRRVWDGWTTAERLRYLDALPRRQTPAQLGTLADRLDLDAVRNAEVRFAWLNLALANRYEPALPQAEAFLAEIGRRKFVLPLYRTLVETGDWGRERARALYARTRAAYHPVTQGSVDRLFVPAPAPAR